MKSIWLFALALSACANAQDTSAILEGQVTDTSSGAMAGVTVRIVGTGNGYSRVQTTTNAGAYHLSRWLWESMSSE
jgi:hypothetical protein